MQEMCNWYNGFQCYNLLLLGIQLVYLIFLFYIFVQITDADLNILNVDPTYGGATHDSFIFN